MTDKVYFVAVGSQYLLPDWRWTKELRYAYVTGEFDAAHSRAKTTLQFYNKLDPNRVEVVECIQKENGRRVRPLRVATAASAGRIDHD